MKKESSAKPKQEKVKRKPLKEMGSELKKVSYPSFKKTVQQTGVVISVVLLFTLVIFGFDRLLSLLYELLVKGI
ncbi:MAG: preprotein translocase subunit SecE [Tenericutes bacterium HGW-Tenericutes-4]|nr:MAG: preprotein translocase subunit SecE [Tenericutes bacterium HGW-Tenericutes-4]